MAMTGKNDNPLPGNDDGDGIEKALDRVSDIFSKVSQIDFTRKPTEIDRIFRAIKSNKIAEVKKALDAGFDPNSWNNSGDTPLHLCARGNLVDMAKLLTAHDADPRTGKKDDPKHLPLDDAVNFGKPEMTEFLARQGGYLPGNTIDGWTLLHRACEKGKTRIVQALLDAGADGNEKTGNGATPLLVAVMRAQSDTAEALLEYPAIVDGMNTLFVQTDSQQRSAFQLAVERGMSKLVNKMIDKGIMPNMPDAEGQTPLQHAISRSDIDMVRTLIKHGADLHTNTAGIGTPLMFACENTEISDDATRAEIISLMIKHGADPDKAEPTTGRTPLMVLAETDNRSQSLGAVLAHPVNLNLCDNNGMSAVFHALKNPQSLRQLLDAGASANARHMQDAATPLIRATRDNNTVAVDMLLAAGANPALFDAAKKSALSYARAAMNDNAAEIVQKLETRLQDDLRPQRKSAAKGQAWDL